MPLLPSHTGKRSGNPSARAALWGQGPEDTAPLDSHSVLVADSGQKGGQGEEKRRKRGEEGEEKSSSFPAARAQRGSGTGASDPNFGLSAKTDYNLAHPLTSSAQSCCKNHRLRELPWLQNHVHGLNATELHTLKWPKEHSSCSLQQFKKGGGGQTLLG